MTEFHAHYELRAEIRERVGGTSAAEAAGRISSPHRLLQRAAADPAGATTALVDPEVVLLAVVADFEAAELDPAAIAEPEVPESARARLRRLRRMAERRRQPETAKPARPASSGMQYLWSARQRVVARFGVLIEAPTRAVAQARAEDAADALRAALPGGLAELRIPLATAGRPVLEPWSPRPAADADASLPEPHPLAGLSSGRPTNRPPGLLRHLVEYRIDLHCITRQPGADADDARERALAELTTRGYPEDDDVHGVTMTIDCAEQEPEPATAAVAEQVPAQSPERVLAGIAGEWTIVDEQDGADLAAFRAALRNATVAEIAGLDPETEPADAEPEPPVPTPPPADAPVFEVTFLTRVYYCGYVWARDEEHAHAVVAEDVDARAEDDCLDRADHDLDSVEFEVVHVGPHKPRGKKA